MNEQIKQIIKQAEEYADSYWDRYDSSWFQYYNEKLAELIVEECSIVCEMNPHFNNHQLANLIKIHFGVK